MANARPTFSEHWHRVTSVKAQLRPGVRTSRQDFRGQLWHVLTDPAANDYFRIDEGGYRFLALLDGRRNVGEAWDLAQTRDGDLAPTQGEAIRLLGNLWNANLLRADLPPDSQRLFERLTKRRRREITSQLTNFLFVRIPLVDPDRFLRSWVGVVGWVFGPVGLTLWIALMAAAASVLIGRYDDLAAGADPQRLLRPENLLLLYACFIAVKALHELGHGFAAAHFGKRNGGGGEVHAMGVMLLVFAPVPYVDATSSWALRDKWQRAFIGAAGMYVELAVAAAAAIVWSFAGATSTPSAVAYNIMLVAGLSTVLFNGNPLLRFDGYYILSDLLEVPNLAQRAREQLTYLVRRHAFAVRGIHGPAHSRVEAVWLGLYGLAAMVFRLFLGVAIILYVGGLFFTIGLLMAAAAATAWLLVPAGKFLRYLGTSAELTRVRGRAIAVTLAAFVLIFLLIGAVPMPDRGRAIGIVEPRLAAVIHMPEQAILREIQPDHAPVGPDSPPLLLADSPQLRSDRRSLAAEIEQLTIERELHRADSTRNPAGIGAIEDRMAALTDRLAEIDRRLASLEVRAPFRGLWVSPESRSLTGATVRRGERLGLVIDETDPIIRVAADQDLGPRLAAAGPDSITIEMRLHGRPADNLTGRIERILPAGQANLPSEALGYAIGGTVAVSPDDPGGTRTAEPFFELQIRPDTPATPHGRAGPLLRAGQRVEVRFSLGRTPLLTQWTRAARQLIQRRFAVPL